MKKETKQDIVNRLQESLSAQQKSVPQLPAQAQPKKIKALGSKTDPKHPFSGYMVGADESAGNGLQKLDPESVQPGHEVIVYLGRDINNIDPKYLETAKVDEVVYANGKAYAVVWTERSGERKPSFDRVFAKPLSEGERNEMDTPEFQDSLAALKKQAEKGKTRAVLNPKTGKYIFVPVDKLKKKDVEETAAWRRKEGKSKSGGLNAKGVASYRRENPGSKLQTAVTTKPSKLKAGSKDAKRRKSFCARMSGVKGPMKKPNGDPTRKALALRKWNCNEEVAEMATPAAIKAKNKAASQRAGVRDDVANEGNITKTATGLVHHGKYGKEKIGYDDYNHGEHVNSLNKIQVRDLERGMDVHWPINKGGRPKDDKIAEAVANEDVLSALKNKLGDLLLQTLGREANDSDLRDKPSAQDDKEVCPIIKKITTDDGREICIHGNEDDGFHISVKGKEGSTKFESLEHAEIASKMYCARRRNRPVNTDYIDEA